MGDLKYIDCRKANMEVIPKQKQIDVADDLSQEFLDMLNQQFALFGSDIKNLSETLNSVIDVVNKHAETLQYLMNKEQKHDNGRM